MSFVMGGIGDIFPPGTVVGVYPEPPSGHDPFVPGTDQVVTLTVDATGVTYTIGLDGGTPQVVAYNASATALRDALYASVQTELAAAPSAGITVTGGPGDSGGTTPYIITFSGFYGNTSHSIAIVDTALTGGAGTAVAVTTTPGGPLAVPLEAVEVDEDGSLTLDGTINLRRVASDGDRAVHYLTQTGDA